MQKFALLLAILIVLGGIGSYLFSTVPHDSVVGGDSPEELQPSPSLPGEVIPETRNGSGDIEVPLVTSFEACVAAGNPVMESYPRQCHHDGVLHVEVINNDKPIACTMDAKLCPDGSAVGRTGPDCSFAPCPTVPLDTPSKQIICSPESKLAEFCTREYAPVCGLRQVQCVTTPCDPIPETFSNACTACSQGNVISYSAGACEL